MTQLTNTEREAVAIARLRVTGVSAEWIQYAKNHVKYTMHDFEMWALNAERDPHLWAERYVTTQPPRE